MPNQGTGRCKRRFQPGGTNDEMDRIYCDPFRVCAGRSHIFPAGKMGEAGSRNFVSDGEQNIRDHIPYPYSNCVIVCTS